MSRPTDEFLQFFSLVEGAFFLCHLLDVYHQLSPFRCVSGEFLYNISFGHHYVTVVFQSLRTKTNVDYEVDGSGHNIQYEKS